MTPPSPSASPWQRGLVRTGAAVVAALLCLLVVLVAVANQRRDAALAFQRHSYEVLLVIRDFDVATARAEAALGRFAISGASGSGRTYFDQWSLAALRLDTLADLTASDPVQRPLVRTLRRLHLRRGQELGLPARSARARQGWAAMAAFDRAGTSATLVRLSAVVERLSRNERRTLTGLSIAADRSGARSNLLAALLSALGVLLGIVGVVLASFAIRAVRARREAGRRAGALERAVADRTRELRDANARLVAEAATRAAAEAQLHQAQKMEAIGQLTGGIAHDFNNMLAVVVGGIELAKRRAAGQPGEIGRHLDHALDGATRAAALTRRLLAFARAEPLRPERVDAGRLVRGMSDLLDRALGERIVVRIAVATDGWPIWCDPHQLENAILNLAVNARDALEGEGGGGGGGGTVTLATADTPLGEGEVEGLGPGDYLRIDVRDDGCGMAPDVAARAFEPFFTTKPVGKGTGLGLSQIFGFVRQSGGGIAIASAPGAGTCVSLYLPRYAGVAASPPPLPATPAPTEGGGERVMVVEDDARVRASTVEALAELGYRPLACACGEDALAALAVEPGIRLVISDVVMPGMTGPDLVARIRADHPGIATIFVTGYVGDADNGDRLRGHAVLRKPFTIAGLAQAVSQGLATV